MQNTGDCSLSRRKLLAGVSAAGLALPMAQSFSSGAAHAQSGAMPGGGFTPRSAWFTVAERDRRWGAVRAIMAKPQWNLDAIITTASDLPGSYARYLTQIGGRAGGGDGTEVIFPRDAAQPAYAQVGGGRFRDHWKRTAGSWMADGKLVVGDGGGSEALAKQIAAQGLNRAGMRIGVAKLSCSRFESEGLVASAYLDNLKKALPGVIFVPIDKWGADAGPIEESSMIKGPEEQAAIRQAVAASEHGVNAMVTAIRAGAKTQGELWFATFTAMFARTGEDPTRVSIGLDGPGNSTIGEPTSDALKVGQILNEEIDATVQGYRAQVNHAVFVGGPSTPGYDYYRAAFDIVAKLLNETPSTIVPGKTTLGEFCKRYAARVEEMGAEDVSGVMLHSSGTGNLSRPRVGPKSAPEDHEIVFRPGMTFDYKPSIRLKRDKMADAGARNREVQAGEHFLVTEQGAVRLGKREIAPLTTQT